MKKPTASFFLAEVITGEPHLYPSSFAAPSLVARGVPQSDLNLEGVRRTSCLNAGQQQTSQQTASLFSDLHHRLRFRLATMSGHGGSMRINSTLQAAALPHFLEPPRRRLLIATATLAVAFLGLALPGSSNNERAGRVASTAARAATDQAAQLNTRPSTSLERTRASTFFGFLEFDWDPDAPGGVPGFDPWPQTPQHP